MFFVILSFRFESFNLFKMVSHKKLPPFSFNINYNKTRFFYELIFIMFLKLFNNNKNTSNDNVSIKSIK